ncbi:hypothetical protein HYH03_007821 [Edaphochlamys debaryana]|uniref:Uncharacterized protein n=1 Tax=Edaphochlamys debaryana TaxID=47281 RepID=A0A836BZY4_9CHLO|nr:hypothetical protein HYH03_007821 [Edaphochlamys debaryana]|eukprot:KAG2493884.1 hypothetical protein HYH03_007821 [Edaphochlamys debaryana]
MALLKYKPDGSFDVVRAGQGPGPGPWAPGPGPGPWAPGPGPGPRAPGPGPRASGPGPRAPGLLPVAAVIANCRLLWHDRASLYFRNHTALVLTNTGKWFHVDSGNGKVISDSHMNPYFWQIPYPGTTFYENTGVENAPYSLTISDKLGGAFLKNKLGKTAWTSIDVIQPQECVANISYTGIYKVDICNNDWFCDFCSPQYYVYCTCKPGQFSAIAGRTSGRIGNKCFGVPDRDSLSIMRATSPGGGGFNALDSPNILPGEPGERVYFKKCDVTGSMQFWEIDWRSYKFSYKFFFMPYTEKLGPYFETALSSGSAKAGDPIYHAKCDVYYNPFKQSTQLCNDLDNNYFGLSIPDGNEGRCERLEILSC